MLMMATETQRRASGNGICSRISLKSLHPLKCTSHRTAWRQYRQTWQPLYLRRLKTVIDLLQNRLRFAAEGWNWVTGSHQNPKMPLFQADLSFLNSALRSPSPRPVNVVSCGNRGFTGQISGHHHECPCEDTQSRRPCGLSGGKTFRWDWGIP